MKTRITLTVASLALATALLTGSGAAFAATPDAVNPALYELGDLGVPVDLGAPGNVGDADAHVAGALGIADAPTTSVGPILGTVESIPAQAAGAGVGIAGPAVQGGPVPALPFPLP